MEQRAGYIGFAVQSDDIEREVAAMRARGVDVRGPQAGKLVAPNGTARGWRSALVGGDDLWSAATPLPFLIQHDTTGVAHQRELGGAGGLAPHPNGATRILGLAIASDDLSALRERFERVYGLASAAAPYQDDALGAAAVSLTLAGGAEEDGAEYVTLAQPTSGGRAAERLGVAGPGLCLATIAVTARDAAVRWLGERDVAAEMLAGGAVAVRVPGARCGWIVLREAAGVTHAGRKQDARMTAEPGEVGSRHIHRHIRRHIRKTP